MRSISIRHCCAAVILLMGCLSEVSFLSPAAVAQMDTGKPFSVGSVLSFPAPEYLFTNGMETRGVLSGPVNAPRDDLEFFTHPAFDKKGNSGRLYYQVFRFANRHDPYLPEQSAWFICWQPVRMGKSNGTGTVQRLFPRNGYDILEIETDGRSLLLRLTPPYGSKRTDTATDRYRWAGDPLGHGRFIPEGKAIASPHLLPLPNAFQKHRDLGYALLSDSEWERARAEFRKAIALRPGDAACWFALGVAQEGNGVTRGSSAVKEAIAAYGRAIAFDPARTPAYRIRAGLYVVEKQYDKALNDLTRVIQQEPDRYTNYTLRAQIFARKGDFARAAADARKAALLEPTESEPLTLLADYQYRAGNFPQAIVSAQKALIKDDTDNQARLILAYIYARQNQTGKAQKQLSDARDHGIATSERMEGMTEIRRILKIQPNSAALQAVYATLRGPEELDPL